MCEYCQSKKTWSTVLEKGLKQRCQWDEYFKLSQYRETDPASRIPAVCSQAPTQRVRYRHVMAHLCEKDKLHVIAGAAERKECGDDSKREYLPIQAKGFRCEMILKLPAFPKPGENYDYNGIIRCGLPATQVEVYWEEMRFCDEHASKFRALEEANNRHVLRGRYLFQKETIELDQVAHKVFCARKGCGTTADGDIDSLPFGWRVIVIARGSLLKKTNLMNADWDGVLCPQHAQEINNMLIELAI